VGVGVGAGVGVGGGGSGVTAPGGMTVGEAVAASAAWAVGRFDVRGTAMTPGGADGAAVTTDLAVSGAGSPQAHKASAPISTRHVWRRLRVNASPIAWVDRLIVSRISASITDGSIPSRHPSVRAFAA